MIVVCPLLQRLNLRSNTVLSLEDLRVIASCCLDLEGLNLMDVPIPRKTSSLIAVWEILSSMKKLAYLSVDTTFLGSSLRIHEVPHKQLVVLFEKCAKLQALELSNASFAIHTTRNDYELLSHFPSLEYCRVISSLEYTCVQEQGT